MYINLYFFLPAYFGPPLMKTWYLVSPFTKVMKKKTNNLYCLPTQK